MRKIVDFFGFCLSVLKSDFDFGEFSHSSGPVAGASSSTAPLLGDPPDEFDIERIVFNFERAF